MLAPHHTENAQLCQGWLPAHEVENFFVFIFGNAVALKNFGRNSSRSGVFWHALRGNLWDTFYFRMFSPLFRDESNLRSCAGIRSLSSVIEESRKLTQPQDFTSGIRQPANPRELHLP